MKYITRLLIVIAYSLMTASGWRYTTKNNNRFSNMQHSSIYYNPTTHFNWNLVNSPVCGTSLSESRIIGGRDASLGEFPWLVQIFTEAFGMAPSFDCGGTIINSKYVVSAGHCFSDYITISFLRVGEYNTGTNPDCDDFTDICAPPYRDYHSEKLIKHEKFSKPDYLNNDITLIRIREVIQFNDFVRPICLPFGPRLRNEYLPGNILEVAGWGADKQIQTQDGIVNKPSAILQKLKMPVVDNLSCSKALKLSLRDTQVCAGGIEGLDACAGDSGGPLMKYTTLNNSTFHYFLIGIVSYGPTLCAQKGVPGVYTRIDHYVNWILDNIY